MGGGAVGAVEAGAEGIVETVMPAGAAFAGGCAAARDVGIGRDDAGDCEGAAGCAAAPVDAVEAEGVRDAPAGACAFVEGDVLAAPGAAGVGAVRVGFRAAALAAAAAIWAGAAVGLEGVASFDGCGACDVDVVAADAAAVGAIAAGAAAAGAAIEFAEGADVAGDAEGAPVVAMGDATAVAAGAPMGALGAAADDTLDALD